MDDKILLHDLHDLHDLHYSQEMAPAEVSEVDLYQKREKIYTRKIEGFFQRLRLFTGWPLLLLYFYIPWLQWNNPQGESRQAVLFDFVHRKFYVFGLTFWPQDLSMLAWLLIIAAFGLFFITTIAGRVWCGYTCPQTVWTSIYMWIEQRVEGTRNQRIRLDEAPWSVEKVWKKLLKHSLWLVVAFYTGYTFIGYFYPITELNWQLFSAEMSWTVFSWIMFFTCATYINAGWLREQVCMYMCPYARFQAVMFDSNTLIVSYDTERGEPRGSRKRGIDLHETHLGGCIDCQLCKQVCPTGIDIRDGLQYQCIGCALCIDACDSVMQKMQYPRGLIRYTTENALAHRPTQWLRPRLLGYGITIIVMSLVLGARLATRVPLEVNVIRDRDNLFVETVDGKIENQYTLKIANKAEQDRHFKIEVNGLENFQLLGRNNPEIAAGSVEDIRVRLVVNKNSQVIANRPIKFVVTDVVNEQYSIAKESRFISPAISSSISPPS